MRLLLKIGMMRLEPDPSFGDFFLLYFFYLPGPTFLKRNVTVLPTLLTYIVKSKQILQCILANMDEKWRGDGRRGQSFTWGGAGSRSSMLALLGQTALQPAVNPFGRIGPIELSWYAVLWTDMERQLTLLKGKRLIRYLMVLFHKQK